MKLTVIISLACCLHLSAKTKAQLISLDLKKVPVQQVFREIFRQAGVSVIYDEEQVRNLPPVTIKVNNVPIAMVLDICLKGNSLEYIIEENSISIKPGAGGLKPGLVAQQYFNAALPPPLITVRGKISNENQEPVIASITVKENGRGTTSDGEGFFKLTNIPDDATLIISATNLETIEVKVNHRSVVNVSVKTKFGQEKEVIINGGYYKTSDKLKIGSIVKITSKEIANQPVTNPLMALQGRVPGLDITPNSGVPGGALNIQIRGRNSLRNNTKDGVANSPLYVIDGIPIDPTPLRSGSETSTTVGNGYDPLSTINPANIESIEVLKDADATAIYGSRGANGVILITTKQGRQSATTNFDFNVYSGVGKIVHRVDLLNTQQYLEMRNEAFANDGVAPGLFDFDINGSWDTTRYTDWQKELLGGSAKVNDIQAGLSGGSANTTFRLSTGYHKETTIYSPDFGFNLYSGNLTINHSSSNQRFRVNLSINYGARKSKVFESSQFLTQALQLPPNAPALYNNDGSLNWQMVDLGTFKYSTFPNPLAQLKRTNEMTENTLFASMNLNYDIGAGWQIKSNFGYTYLTGDELIKDPISVYPPAYITSGTTGSANFSLNRRKSLVAEPQIVYAKTLGKNKINFLLGGAWQQSNSVFQQTFASGFASDLLINSMAAATFTYSSADVANEFKYVGGFLRLGYNLDDKYLLNITARRDGSSRFGPGRKFGNFGSIGVAWLFAGENFFKNKLPFLTQGKLRGSFGITGNDQIGDYLFMNTYSVSQRYRYQNGINLFPTALFNPEFSWEETKKLEAALELGFLKDRVFLEVDWYRNRSSNQLVDYALPRITGFTSVFRNFPATVQNSGWEALLRVISVQTKQFKLTTSLNISVNRNKLVAFPDIETSSYKDLYKVGEPLTARLVFHYIGINPTTGLREVEDVDGNGILDFTDYHFGMPTARLYYGGLTNTLEAYGFDLAFTFQFSKQNKGNFVSLSTAGIDQNMPVQVLDRWRKEGDETPYQKFSQSFEAGVSTNNFLASDGNGVDASFIRLKTLSVGYSLPQTWLNALGLNNARLFLQGQNLVTFTNYTGLDPETEQGLPPLQMMSGGFSLRF